MGWRAFFDDLREYKSAFENTEGILMLYGVIGTSDLYSVEQGLEYLLPAGAILVVEDRPDLTATLKEDGTWELPTVPQE